MLMFDFLEFMCSAMIIYCSSEFIIKYSKELALSIGVSDYIIGLTVIAFGTSFPELIVSTNASIIGESSIAYGNIVGSNIANIALVLSLAIIINRIKIRDFDKNDILFFLLSALMLLLFSIDGKLSFYEGGLLFFIFSLYCLKIKREVTSNYKQNIKEPLDFYLIVILVLSFALLVIGSNLFIGNAISIATNLGISKVSISLTIVAIGTSLPELAMGIVASLKKEHDLLIGGIVGSNIMNILLVLGLSVMIEQVDIGLDLAPIIMMLSLTIIVSFYCILKITMSRIVGFVLLIIYWVFIYSNLSLNSLG